MASPLKDISEKGRKTAPDKLLVSFTNAADSKSCESSAQSCSKIDAKAQQSTIRRIEVNEFAKLMDTIEELFVKKGEPVVLWFKSTVDSDGKNWCPDCEASNPIIEKFLQNEAVSKKRINILEVELFHWKNIEMVHFAEGVM